jgi:protocatechuate 3,4-dioxygenase beta subunit
VSPGYWVAYIGAALSLGLLCDPRLDAPEPVDLGDDRIARAGRHVAARAGEDPSLRVLQCLCRDDTPSAIVAGMPPVERDDDRSGFTRRRFLEGSALVPIVFAAGACGADDEPASSGAASASGTSEQTTSARTSAEAAAEAGDLRATPSCDDGDDPTPEQTEGPFYTPDTPRRSNLVLAGVSGAPLLLTGDVVDTRCRPVRGALLDFWQADSAGEYDNDGFRLRGHQFADARGRFGLRTIVPGLYPGRTRHIHVKVQRPHGQVLTTQLYFPGEPRNRTDSIFDGALLMDIRRAGSTRRARFRFVLD